MLRAARRAASLALAQQRRALSAGGSAFRAPPGQLRDFLPPAAAAGPPQWLEAVTGAVDERASLARGAPSSVFLETYGCQMNTNDSEIVLRVLRDAGYAVAEAEGDASVILLNTCAIRERAEDKVWSRLRSLQYLRKRRAGRRPVVGVLGCMAERLKDKLLEGDRLADVVAGPDAYRDLPRLLELVRSGSEPTSMNVQLSADETYADIAPVRSSGVSAFVSITRGCNNLCAFCVVPYTRGRERSRPADSIVDEIATLAAGGVREVTLLGQNVNSYCDFGEGSGGESGGKSGGGGGANSPPRPSSGDAADPFAVYARGFTSVYKPKRGGAATTFPSLLRRVAAIHPELRVRFTSPHPKDFPDGVLALIAATPNICKQLHLPAQSGSTAVLSSMRRGYSREAYIALADRARLLIPHVAISSDFISGFCGETETDHSDTLSLISLIGYEQAFMFAYSERGKTHAARHLPDDVPPAVKQRRLAEVIAIFRAAASARAATEVGAIHCVLVEGRSKKSGSELMGKSDSGRVCVFPDVPLSQYVPDGPTGTQGGGGGAADGAARVAPGRYVAFRVERAFSGTLVGTALGATTLASFQQAHGAQSVAATRGAERAAGEAEGAPRERAGEPARQLSL